MKCQICRKHEAEYKDYRFIDSCGLQGKVISCGWCKGLNDEAIREIIREEINPKEYYDDNDSQD